MGSEVMAPPEMLSFFSVVFRAMLFLPRTNARGAPGLSFFLALFVLRRHLLAGLFI